ncbi:MAG: hypothetical protein JNK00_05735 [Flavipsychrobacter sp.]|nr:hypothetical protein [Flavipsychrobacter sp.]
MKKILVLFISVITFSGCYFDKEDQLYPKTTTGCDTTNVTFSATVLPVMQQKCATAGCHDALVKQSGYDLNLYADVKKCVTDNKLLPVIRQDAGAKAMPQGGAKLDDCTISKISAWVNRGMLNN